LIVFRHSWSLNVGRLPVSDPAVRKSRGMRLKCKLNVASKPPASRTRPQMPGRWAAVFPLLSLCGVLLYAVVMPSMMVSTIEVANSQHKFAATLTSWHNSPAIVRLTGKSQLRGNKRSRLHQELSLMTAWRLPNAQPTQGLTWH
jgi:hypothetical protein